MTQSKEDIRNKQLKQLKLAENNWEKEQDELILYQKLFMTTEWKNAQNIGITISQAEEIDTKPIILKALLEKKEVYIPKTLPKRKMVFVHLKSEINIKRNNMGILEPVEPYETIEKKMLELLIIPGVAYSKSGDRIGYGGGFYDRYLFNFSGDVIALADRIRYFEKCAWKIEETDIKIPKILSI